MHNKDIPREFFSFETNAPFETCIECNKYLLDGETEYLIEKAIRNYQGYKAKDVIFDFAICMDCMQNRGKAISQESAQNISQYFQSNIDIERKLAISERNFESNLDKCMIKGTSVNSLEEYQICGYFKGRKMNLDNPPYLISGEVMEELLPLLSEKTIDEMNGFFKKHFSPDPSFFQPTPKLILV
jgi:hypothetical protein